MKKFLLLISMSLSCVANVFAATGDGKVFTVVFQSEDENKGSVSTQVGKFLDEASFNVSAYPKRGYVFSGWTSAKGYSTVIAEGDDTLTAHFKALPAFDIVFLSSDTAKGTITETKVLYYQDEEINHDNVKCVPGWSFERWVNPKGQDEFYVSKNDTLTAIFAKYVEKKEIKLLNRELHSVYGNLLEDYSSEDDSVYAVNKRTGERKAYRSGKAFDLQYGDTLVLDSQTVCGYTIDDPNANLEVVCDSTTEFRYEASKIVETVELEEAVGDSFKVVIYNDTYKNDSMVYKVAKGEKLSVKYETADWNSWITIKIGDEVINNGCDTRGAFKWRGNYYLLRDEFTVNVVNDILLQFVFPETASVKNLPADPVELEPIVNVYDNRGRLLKRNVKRSEALYGLEKGIYIVGRKKIIVM